MTRLMGVALLQFTLPGAPTIYYGDEVGLVGPTAYSGGKWEDDPYNRLPFPWLDATGTPYYTHLQSGGAGWTTLLPYYQLLTATRKAHEALRTGSFDTLLVDDTNDIYSYGRLAADDAAVVIANRGATQNVTVDVSGYLAVGTQLVNALDDALYTVAADGSVTVPNVPTLSGALLVLTGTLATAPAAVTDLAVVAERGGELDLSWTAVADADSYDLYRSLVSGGGYEFVANVVGTTYTDTGLQNAITYYYVLVSKNDTTLLASGYSNEASGMPHYTINWANLQWPPTIAHTVGITPTENIYGQVRIDGITVDPGATAGLWAQVGFGPDGSNPDGNTDWVWFDTTFNTQSGNNDEFKGQLVPEAVGVYDYAYRYSTTGGLDWLYADLDSTDNGYDPAQAGALTVNPAADTTPPAVPLNLRVTTWTADSVSLEWDPVADTDLYAYDLYREEAAKGTPAWLARVMAPEVTYVDTNVTVGQTYTYTVQALDTAFNRSAFSNAVSATPMPRMVELRFIVDVPAFTPPADTVYIAGNNAAVFGASWNPSAQPMTKTGPTTWQYSITTDEGLQLEYKYTRGSWDLVENWGTLVGTNNRTLTTNYGATGVMTVTNTVHNWRDVLVMATYPEDGATDWEPTQPISVTFSRDLNAALITSSTFILEQLARAPIPGTLSVSTFTQPYTDPDFGDGVITGTLVLFDPDVDLPTGSSFRVQLVKSGFAYGDGAMQNDFFFTFGPPTAVGVHHTSAQGYLPLGLAAVTALGAGIALLRRRRK